MSVISVGRNGSAVVPCRLGLGCRPGLGFSSSSLSHARRVTPAHTLTHTHALLHLPTHSFCRYTRHTYTNTHLIPVSAAVHTVRLQLVSTPLRLLVAGLSANIIPLVWTGLNRTVRVFVCIRVFVCVHVSLCQSMWAVLVVILWFSMHMCGQVWFCACEPRGGRGGCIGGSSQLYHQGVEVSLSWLQSCSVNVQSVITCIASVCVQVNWLILVFAHLLMWKPQLQSL